MKKMIKSNEDFLEQLSSTSLVLRLAILSTVTEELHKCNPKLAEEQDVLAHLQVIFVENSPQNTND